MVDVNGSHMYQKCKFGVVLINFSSPVNEGHEGRKDGCGVVVVPTMVRCIEKWQNANICEI